MSAVIDLTLGDFDGDEMGEVNRQRTRIHSKDSAWTGPEFKTRVERVHISGQQFTRISGVNARTFRRWVDVDQEGGIPLWAELVVEFLERYPPARHWERGGVENTARHSSWTGAELKQRLAELGVAGRQFARMTGINASSIERWLSGKSDGDIPKWVEVVVDLLRRFPDTRTREHRDPGRPKVVLDGKPRNPPDWPPPRAKPWPEMKALLETAKPTVGTMPDADLLAEYNAFDTMDGGPMSDEEMDRWDLVAEECFKRGLA